MEWWNGFTHNDRAYQSKVFTFSPDFEYATNEDEIITGGTGYKDYSSLPPEVEAMPPDYSIYPSYKRVIGFLTRAAFASVPDVSFPRKRVLSDQRPHGSKSNARTAGRSSFWTTTYWPPGTGWSKLTAWVANLCGWTLIRDWMPA